MDEFDPDLVDELCSSFCAPRSDAASDDYAIKCVDEPPAMLSRKRTSTSTALDTSMSKKVCLHDMTNRSMMDPRDEMQTLDESALQMLVRCRVWNKTNFQKSDFSVKNGNHLHSSRPCWTEWLVYWKSIATFDLSIVRRRTVVVRHSVSSRLAEEMFGFTSSTKQSKSNLHSSHQWWQG